MEGREEDGTQGEGETTSGEDQVKTVLIVAFIIAGAGGDVLVVERGAGVVRRLVELVELLLSGVRVRHGGRGICWLLSGVRVGRRGTRGLGRELGAVAGGGRVGFERGCAGWSLMLPRRPSCL